MQTPAASGKLPTMAKKKIATPDSPPAPAGRPSSLVDNRVKPMNRSLHAARANKQDEFYTQLSDIEKELRHYARHFKDKTVLCNCDDPRVSNFFKYFLNNFEKLGLKKVITTCYKNDQPDLFSQNKSAKGIYFEYSGEQKGKHLPDPAKIKPRDLKSDGDFRSEECIDLLKQADIVITNPPFSLFREYVEQLVRHNKKFVIIGSINAISYKEVFSLVKDNRLWLGPSIHSGDREFGVPDYYPLDAAGFRVDATGKKFIRVKGVRWFTNLDYEERHEQMVLFNAYAPSRYPRYDNYDAIEVSKTAEIPADYDGAMGVPITFLDKYNPDQFEILGITDRGNVWGLKTKDYTRDDVRNANDLNRRAAIKVGKKLVPTYARLLIRRTK